SEGHRHLRQRYDDPPAGDSGLKARKLASPSASNTGLTEAQYAECWGLVLSYLRKHGSIQNKQFRVETGLGYDQAIRFFKRATTEKRLKREGIGSRTCYFLRNA
ncbi:MAG: hypothetical protein ACREB3_06275, partial [Burkholderiales bacterium]